MAIVSRFGVDNVESVKKAAKQSLTQRYRQKVGISDASGLSSESEDSEDEAGSAGVGTGETRPRKDTCSDGSTDQDATFRGKLSWRTVKTAITAAAKPPSPTSPSVGSGFVGRRVGSGDIRHSVRGGWSRRILRWVRFLRTRI